MKEDKQKRIMEKGIELFCEVGYLNTTVEKITNSLNISKGSFYTYFESKEALLLSILDFMYISYGKILNKLSETIYLKGPENRGLEDILEEYISVMIDSILESKSIMPLIQQVFTNDFFKSEEIKKKVYNFRSIDVEFIKEFISKKIDFKYEIFDLNLISEYIVLSIHTFVIIKMKEGEIEFVMENKARIVKDIKLLLLYGILKEEL